MPNQTPQPVPAPVRAIEVSRDRSRGQVDLLVRRPFYLNLRLGRVQNALWFGHRGDGAPRTVFNTLRGARTA